MGVEHGAECQEISQVLLADGWHTIDPEGFSLVPFWLVDVDKDGGERASGAVPGFCLWERGGNCIRGPLTSVLALIAE